MLEGGNYATSGREMKFRDHDESGDGGIVSVLLYNCVLVDCERCARVLPAKCVCGVVCRVGAEVGCRGKANAPGKERGGSDEVKLNQPYFLAFYFPRM